MFLQESDDWENRIYWENFFSLEEKCATPFIAAAAITCIGLKTHSGHSSQHYSKSALRHFFPYSVLQTEHWTMSDTCTQVPHRLVPCHFHSLWLARKSEDLTKKIMVWCVLLWRSTVSQKTGDTQIYFQSRLKSVFGTASLHTLITHSKNVFSSFSPDFCCQERTIIDNSLRLLLLVLPNTSFTPKASGQMKAKQRQAALSLVFKL